MNDYSKLLSLGKGLWGLLIYSQLIRSVGDTQLGTCNWNLNWVGSFVGLHK